MNWFERRIRKKEQERKKIGKLLRMLVDLMQNHKWTKRFIDKFISRLGLCHSLYRLGWEEIWLWQSLEVRLSEMDTSRLIDQLHLTLVNNKDLQRYCFVGQTGFLLFNITAFFCHRHYYNKHGHPFGFENQRNVK